MPLLTPVSYTPVCAFCNFCWCCSCTKDHVQVFNIASKHLHSDEDMMHTLAEKTLVGKYCGEGLPGPQMSEENSHEMLVTLTTNDYGVEQGFRARYEFVEKSPSKRTYARSCYARIRTDRRTQLHARSSIIIVPASSWLRKVYRLPIGMSCNKKYVLVAFKLPPPATYEVRAEVLET